METKSNIRRLLAGSSLVALLAASGPALGAGVTISSPTGPVTVSNTIDFIEVTLGGQVGGDLTIASSGIIDLAAQGTSFVGVDINQGDVLGGILNEGHIGVLATSTGLPIGIAVHGSGASIGGTGTSFGIQNDGKITVTGVNSAIGIAVTGTGVNFNAGHDITNNPSGGIGIKVKAHQEAASGQAVAAGIFIDRDFYNDVNNNGSIKVNATELSAVTSGVVSATSAAKASGSAHAIASGMGVGAQNSFAGLPSASEPNVFFGSLNNSGGVLNVQAQASSTHTAQATGSGGFFGNAVASALGIDTTAQAYGMFASAGTIAGNVTNTGNVGAIASANSVNNASAHGVNSTFTSVGDATALASGRVSATATGMRADAQSMLGSVVNSGNLGGQAIAKTTNVASADSTDTANAKASALGDAYALAYGMKGNVGSFIGSFQNNSAGLIDAFATATAKNTATIVDTSGSYAAATAHASSSVSATAFGMAGYFNSFNGIVANAGTINVSAVGAAQNTATVHVNGPATATADNGEYSATAYGDGLYITSNELIAAGSTGVSQGGTIGVLAQATAHHHAQATGTSLAQANAQGSVAAGGAGVFVGVSSFLGNFVNDGGITVTALGTVYSAATAKATGTSAGVADANGNNYAAARGYGINVNGQSFIGDFVNTVNGTLDINATATVFGSAKATGTSLNSASASLYDRAYANAGGINIQNYNSFTGSISNAAELNIGALASTINHATASASTGGASATAIDAYLASYARAYGITANIANMTGNFVNSGAVNASAAVREVDTADASGSAYANANAASNGLGKATGVSVGVGSTLNGSVSNLGTITVDAVVSTDTYAVADATSGSGQASVAGNVIAGALGFAVDGGTISGDIINGGDINAVAAAGAFNGSVSGEMTGLSLVGPGLGMLGYYATGLSFGVAGLAGAVATGTSFTAAHVRGDARAYSTGFRSSANSIGGSVFNSGDIHSGAIAVTTNEAYAHVDGYNTAYAAARGTGAYGNAHGVEIVGSTILGSVVNSSFVGAVALGASLNVAKAEGTSLSAGDATANAYGSAFGTAIGIGIDVNSLAGGFENYGGVSAIGIAAVYNDANALAGTSGTANARAQDVNFAGANATGISLAGNYLDSFRNNGDVSAWALSVSNNVAAAQATGTSYANVAHAQATGSAFADATGIYLSESTIAGAVTNSAYVTAAAHAYVHDDAYAAARSAHADAHNNRAQASATGITVGGTYFQGGFANTGDIYAFAYAGSLPGSGSPSTAVESGSYGVANNAVASGTHYAQATAGGTASANAVGIDLYSEGTISVLPMSTTAVYNDGAIHVGAVAALSNQAYAHATGTSNADAYATAGGDTGEYRYVFASGTGVRINANTVAGDVVNDGALTVNVFASGVNAATAEAADYAQAYAYGGAYAYAYGIQIGADYSPTVIGDIVNNAPLNVHATAFAANVASATGNSAEAYAGFYGANYDYHYGVRASALAYATGINANLNSISGKVINTGDITAAAHATSVDSATAHGTSHAYASSYGMAYAFAYGINVSNEGVSAGISNSGAITVDAVVHTDVKSVAAASTGNAYAYNYAYGFAYAMGINANMNINGDFHNYTGGSMAVHAVALVNATAKATAHDYAEATIASPSASATAYGIYDGNNGTITGSFINDAALTVGARASVTAQVHASSTGTSGSADASIYDSEGGASASATAIYVDVSSIGGSFVNNGNLTVNATAHYQADVTAIGGGSNAENVAYAWASAEASAVGINLYANSMSGNFVNTGDITVNAKADFDSSATASSAYSASAYGNNEGYNNVRAQATGIDAYISTFNGNVSNAGAITVHATATALNHASANGSHHAYATGYGAAYASAYGIYVNGNEGNIAASGITNSGAITVGALVNTDVTALATADTGDASVYGHAYGYAYAIGINASVGINGDFHNTTGGSIAVNATSVVNATASAIGGTHAYASIYSPSVTAGAAGIYDNSGSSITGSFINDGAITIGAKASANVVVFASTTGVSAGADAQIYDNEGGADVKAAGIYVNVNSIGGNFVNNGDIGVNATAHYAATVSALGGASNGENSAYAWASATAEAVGISLYANSMVGNVINTANITVAAKADTDSSAKATAGTSGDAHAYAANNEGYNSAQATATGIDAYVGTFGGSFTNSGDVTVNATATALGSASVSGPSAWATADSYARAYATGVALSGSQMTSVGGVILNSSLIDVAAKALATATMLLGAAGSGIGYASANARGRGMEVYSGGLLQNSVVNGDTITVSGSATATVTSDDGAIAWATAGAGGIGIQAQTFLGGFENTVGSRVSAVANASAEAYGQAYSRAYGYAGATGVSISGYQTLSGNVVNDGTIIADANAHARGTGTSHGHVGAYARGLYIYGNSFIGQIYNSGEISAAAVASGTGVMRSYASATGVYVDINTGTGNTYAFYNNGAIGAQATAGDTATAKGASFNGGSFAGAFENVGSFTTNEGTFVAFTAGFISADAKATDGGNAKAVAVDLNGTTFAGGLDNSGVISAHASAPGGTATATAILVEEGGYLGASTINNTGIIRATATGTSVTTNAINLDGAGGGTLINQIGQTDEGGNVLGGIYGDIQLNNGYGDLIDWTGGKIVGDIHGTTLDNFHVYAGLDNSFVFSGNINAGNSDSSGNYVADASRFGALTIGTGGSLAPAVSLEVAGNMYLGALNVQNNATLIVDPTAQIDASTVTIAGTGISTAAGTVQWNIQPVYPQNGSITGDVSIGTGAKSVANGLPGLFAATNDFWVIKDPNGVTGEFVTGTNPTTTDVTTVTPLGNFLNGLYTVTDGYVTSGAEQGYHIYVTRMSFADIPGLTEDGTNYGTYVDTILNNLQQNDPTGPLATLLGQILTGTPEEYAHALNEMSGHQNGDLLLAALGDPSKLLQIIFSELGGGDLGGSGGVASLDTFVQVADNGTISASTMNDAGPQYAALGTPTSVVERPASAWVRVFGNWSSLDRDASVGSNGYTANGGGVVVGGDYKFSDTFKAGLAAGYQKNKIDFRGAGNADTDSYSLSAYGRYTQGPLYVNGLLGASLQQYDMTRYYTPLATTYSAYRKPNGSTYSMGVEAGYAFDLGDNSKVTPFAGLMYSHTKIDGGTETGTGPGNLTLSEQSADSTASRLGVRWSKTFATDSGSTWTPIVELGWRHEFSDTNPSTTATLAGLPGSYTINGSDVPADAALVGLGLKLQLSDDIDGTVQYNGDFTSKSTNSTASVKIRMKF